MVTTTYGTWNNRVEPYAADFETSVIEAFGSEGPDGSDFDGIVSAYRATINEALPPGVSLCGSEFYGPYYAADRDFADYPADEDGRLDIAEIVHGIDFWEIAQQYQQED